MTAYSVPAPLAKALADRGYADLTPVQSAVLAPEAAERDLLVSAQTGSGKTVAFGIGMGSTLLGEADKLDRPADPLALIVAPTRELAMQVQRELEWLYAPAGGRVIACVGGMDPRRERRLLDAGAHIVVGTPGRLKDHIERKSLLLADVRAVILDEADEMLDLGFREDLEFILETTPETRRTLLFSATLPKGIVALAGKFQRDALRIAAASNSQGHADIEYRALRTHPRETEHAIVNVLRQVDSPASIIFCNTRDGVRHLQATLVERGFSAVYLSGELSQNERNQSLQALRDGRARICVATDVAARGIDLPNLGLVIHADLPLNAEILQHRSGRTGRAGRKGISVLVIPPSRRRKAERLIGEAKLRPEWMDPPTADDIRALDRQRFLDDPLLTEETSDEDRAMAAVVLAQKSAEDIAAILAKLYRSRLPEPEELSEPEAMHPPRQERGRDRERGFDKRRGGDDRFERGNRDRSARNDFQRDDRFVREPEPLVARADTAIFKLAIGRKQKADPKWLLPMICRRGNISRQEIGTIRIFEDRTEVEISKAASEHFALHASRPDSENIRITPGGGAETANPSQDAPQRSRKHEAALYEQGARREVPAHDTRRKPKQTYDDRPSYKARGEAPRKPAFQKPEHREKRVFQDYGDRPPYDARKSAPSDRPAYAKKRDDGDASANRGRDLKNKSYEGRSSEAEGFENTKNFDDRKPYEGKKSFAGKKSFEGKKNFEAKKPFGNKKRFGNKKPFGKGPKSDARSGFAHRKKKG